MTLFLPMHLVGAAFEPRSFLKTVAVSFERPVAVPAEDYVAGIEELVNLVGMDLQVA